MRAWASLLLCMVIAAPRLQAACGGEERTIRDPALHRAWLVVRDCAHPERPAQLREISWDAAGQSPDPIGRSPSAHRPGLRPQTQQRDPTAAWPDPEEVRPGMRVEVWSQDGLTQVHLVGTALGAARVGEKVAFRVRLNGVVRHGVVRGPATIELVTEGMER